MGCGLKVRSHGLRDSFCILTARQTHRQTDTLTIKKTNERETDKQTNRHTELL